MYTTSEFSDICTACEFSDICRRVSSVISSTARVFSEYLYGVCVRNSLISISLLQ